VTEPIHVIGASGRSGLALCRALLARGETVVPVVRDLKKFRAAGLGIEPVVADLTEPNGLRLALRHAARVVSCAHARHTGAVISAAAQAHCFVFLGSTRRFTEWPDAHGLGVIEGERKLLVSHRPGVMLHPTMIYGAEGEDNVQRLAALLRRLPFVPLPAGGAALVQPIHQSDVTHSILAALNVSWPHPTTLVIAGPEPLPYADFVRAVSRAAGLRQPRIVSLPELPLRLAAPLTRLLPLVPRIEAAEIRRLTEDKAFDISLMIERLGVRPISLDEGLAQTFRSFRD
jgi:uncharacterized protein YbjT (DUF2867 family)